MANDDLKQHIASQHDFYALLDLPSTASQDEIRRAYRKTALKYHPDKVGANDHAALDKFHTLQIAYDVLSDAGVKEQYDAHRHAREAAKFRDEQLNARRSEMKRDLERREQEGLKRKRGEAEGDVAWQQELHRIREDTKRRKVELEERRRQEQQEHLAAPIADDPTPVTAKPTTPPPVTEIQRSIKIRYPVDSTTSNFDSESLKSLFSRFGDVEDALIRSKAADTSKRKKEKSSNKPPRATGLLVFKSVVGAHAAVTDFPRLAVMEPEKWGVFDFVEWAEGKEPDFVPRRKARVEVSTVPGNFKDAQSRSIPNSLPLDAGVDGVGTKTSNAPKFSFKGGPTTSRVENGAPSLDEITMMRLKNAERRRLEEKIRREEAAADADGEMNT